MRVAHVGDDGQLGGAGHGDEAPVGGLLSLARRVLVVVVEPSFSYTNHPGGARKLGQRGPIGVLHGGHIVRMHPDRRVDVGFRGGKRDRIARGLEAAADAYADERRHPTLARTLEDLAAICAEVLGIQVTV